MKRRFTFCFILFGVLMTFAHTCAATGYIWIGGSNTAWNNANNWYNTSSFTINNGFPGAADAATIGSLGFINQPNVNVASSCTSLTFNSSFGSGAILTVSAAFSVSGSITTVSGNTIKSVAGGTISAGSMSITATTFDLKAIVTVLGNMTFNNGSSSYTSTALTTAANIATNTGTLTLAGALSTPNNMVIKGTTINGNSVATINTAGMSLTSAVVTLNGVLTSTAVVQVPSPGGTDCTLTTNAAGNTIAGVYDHSGSNLTWNGSGTTTCTQGDVSSGQTLTIGAGNSINFTGNFELHGTGSTDGILVNNGNITMTNVSLFSDNLGSGSGTSVTNSSTGSITLNGSSAQLSIGGFSNMSNAGTITANSGSTITASASTTITNTSSGTITMNTATMNLNGNPSTLNNAGQLNMTGGTLNATGTSPVISNSGTINASGTTANLSGNGLSFTNTGTFAETSNAKFNFTGNPQSITNSATISLDASTLTSSGNTTPIINSGNFTFANASTLTISGGGSSPLTNSGNLTATNSTFAFSAGSGNTITNSGVFSCDNTPITFGTGTWTVNNTGTFSATNNSDIFMPGNNSAIKNTAGTFTTSASDITLNGQPSSFQNSSTGTTSISGATVTLAQNAFLQNASSNSLTINGNSTVNFGYGSYITNTGTFYAGTSGSQCILNVTSQTSNIANSTTNGKFYLGSTSIIYLNNASSNVTNTSPGTFTLQSDINGSAAIGAIPSSSGGMVGTFAVERYFQGGSTISLGRYVYRNYRIISSPVSNSTKVNGNYVYGLNYIVGLTAGQTTAANSLTNAFVTGAAGGSTSAGNPSLYLYKESIIPSNATFTSGNFLGITNITNSSSAAGTLTASDGSTYSIPIGNGVLFFDRGAATNWATRTVAPYRSVEAVTLTSTGLINQQSVSVKNWYNSGSATLGYTVTGVGTGANTNFAVRGFNMVGNPYPCSIDWNTAFSGSGITRTNINPTIYFFNPQTSQYDSYITTSASTGTVNGSCSKIIASGQGFFVQANNGGAASLTFTENAKSPTSQLTTGIGGSLLMGTPVGQSVVYQMLRLKLITDSVNFDDITFSFNSTASTNYNSAEDSKYIPGVNAPEGFASISDDNFQLSINSLPLPKLTPQVIKLFVTARNTGQYTIKRTQLDAIPQLYEVWLMDDFKKDSLDIRANTDYVFNIDLADTTSFGNNRFRLVIRQNQALGIHLLNFTAIKATGGSQVNWVTENEQNYTNFTVERSTDNGVTFDVLSGYSSNASGAYGYLDKTPKDGANQYRLKIEDLNGTITYSNVITLTYGSVGSGSLASSNISIYPNPATGKISMAILKGGSTSSTQIPGSTGGGTIPVTSNSSFGIKIIGIGGTVLQTGSTTQATWQGDVSKLSAGSYIMQVINNADNSVVGSGTFIKL